MLAKDRSQFISKGKQMAKTTTSTFIGDSAKPSGAGTSTRSSKPAGTGGAQTSTKPTGAGGNSGGGKNPGGK